MVALRAPNDSLIPARALRAYRGDRPSSAGGCLRHQRRNEREILGARANDFAKNQIIQNQASSSRAAAADFEIEVGIKRMPECIVLRAVRDRSKTLENPKPPLMHRARRTTPAPASNKYHCSYDRSHLKAPTCDGKSQEPIKIFQSSQLAVKWADNVEYFLPKDNRGTRVEPATSDEISRRAAHYRPSGRAHPPTVECILPSACDCNHRILVMRHQ